MPPAVMTTASASRATTFCRICPAMCGLLVDVVDGAVVGATGDRDHPMTRGFTCRKGRNIGRLASDPGRFRTAQRGDRRGGFTPIGTDEAIAEAGRRLRSIVDAHGPDAIGLFLGTQAYQATLTVAVVSAWLRATGTHKFFRTMTIDQSAKSVAAGRLGFWHGGPQLFEDSDVWFFVGTNPLVSMQGGPITGFPVHGGRRALRAARRRGLRLIVADPRRTETAAEADRHLQLRPGTDSLLLSAILHVVLAEKLEDAAFCRDHVDGLDDLRAAVASATPYSVAADTGVDAEDIVAAAREFASSRHGMATTGTGPDMAPWSNLNEHLVQALNVVCGRFPRAGERHSSFSVLAPIRPRHAHVVGPSRRWESGYRSRLGYGLIDGDLPTSTLPREITAPGIDRLRGLVVIGGNPASAIPEQSTVVDALAQLEFLVVVEPFATETARLADLVLPPALSLERPDSTRGVDDWYPEAFAQYTPAVIPAPAGVREDWKIFAGLAAAMDLTLQLGSLEISPDEPMPSSDDLLDYVARHGAGDMTDLRRHPHGYVYPDVERAAVLPAGEQAGRFDLCPTDVASELRAALARERIVIPGHEQLLLAVRRSAGVLNTLGRRTPGFTDQPGNPCRMHPDRLAALGVSAGDLVRIDSAHGSLVAVAEADDSLRSDVATLTHSYGDLPGHDGDPASLGVNPGRLLSLTHDIEDINAMPRMTGVPVSVKAMSA